MRFLIDLILVIALTSIPSFASLNEVDKAGIFNKNLLTNPGWENGLAGWTYDVADTYALTTTAAIGTNALAWNASATAKVVISTAVTIPEGMYGRPGVASCLIRTGSGTSTHSIQAYDGSNVLSDTVITSNDQPVRSYTNFIFPSSGSISLRLYANADEVAISVDDCYLGPAEGYNLSSGAIITAWQDFPSVAVGTLITGTTADPTYGTVVTNQAQWRRVGSNMEIRWDYRHTAIGAAGNGNYLFNLPAGYTIDTGAAAANTALGSQTGTGHDSGSVGIMTLAYATNAVGQAIVSVYDSNSLKAHFFYGNGAASAVGGWSNAGVDFAFSANMSLHLRASVPIVGWSSSGTSYTPDVLANSWAGYHDNTCSMARTNTAYGDPATDASCGLTERANSNFGTVTGANNLPSITFTPKRAGRYYVCASVSVLGATSGADLALKLWDGTTTIAERGWDNPNTSYNTSVLLCGIYVNSTTTAKTLSIQTKSSTGAITIQALTEESAVEWSIFQVDQSLPVPAVVNSVVSSYAGVSKINSANINCDAGSAITSQLGSWVSSVGNIATGACAVTLTTGVYSAAPYCWVEITGAISTGLETSVTASSATAVSVDCEDDGSTACTTFDANLFCIGVP